jgi:putative ABC transport system permease protein
MRATRERRGLPFLEHLIADIRHAFRALCSKPAYTTAVVLTLALGIGANSAMFSIVNAVILRPLPYPQPNGIVSLSIRDKGEDLGVVDNRDYFAWRDAARTVTIAAYESIDGTLITPDAGPESLNGMTVTDAYFSIFGVRPIVGRAFTGGEYRVNGPGVVMLSESLWRRDFGADTALVGRTVVIDGKAQTLVGVVPASFATAQPAVFWTPKRLELPSDPNDADFYTTIGRLRDGVSLDAARAELTGVSARLHALGPTAERSASPVVMTLHEREYGDRRKPLLLLFAAVGVLLLIACANLANLAMARAAGRQQEIAVRLALGAGRWRVVQGMLCETMLSSLAGATLGLLFAVASLAYIMRLSPNSVGNIQGFHLDPTVLGFTALIAVITGVVVGIVPAAAVVRGDVHHALSNGGSHNAGSHGQHLVRRVLVVAQLATALVMLTSAGLVARTFWRVASINPGFQAKQLFAAELRLPPSRYSTQSADIFFAELLSRVRALPNVQSAALTDAPPLMGGGTFEATDTSGRRSPPVTIVDVGPGYFRTIGATLRAGRAIDSTDRRGEPKAVVVNSALARRLFGSGNALGRAMPIGRDTGRIVGVINNVPQRDFEGAPSGAVYWSFAQQGMGSDIQLMVRTSGSVEQTEATITRLFRSMDRTLAPPAYEAMSDVLAERIAPRKFTFVLLGIFATLAASLAAIGLYGVLAHLVASRTREIGIRVALGADPRRVTGLVLRQGLGLAMLGVSIGVVASLVAVPAVRALVYNVSVYDPWTFAIGAGLLVAVSVVASYIPARRASRVDPVIALRAE